MVVRVVRVVRARVRAIMITRTIALILRGLRHFRSDAYCCGSAQDMNWLEENLSKGLQEMSTFDEYRKEVLSNLQDGWTPVHKYRSLHSRPVGVVRTPLRQRLVPIGLRCSAADRALSPTRQSVRRLCLRRSVLFWQNNIHRFEGSPIHSCLYFCVCYYLHIAILPTKGNLLLQLYWAPRSVLVLAVHRTLFV